MRGEQPPRIFHEPLQRCGEVGPACFQPLDVEGLERKERRLDRGEKRRARDQHKEQRADEDRQTRGHHAKGARSVGAPLAGESRPLSEAK